MNGEWLGSRAIRVNWANQKTQTGGRGGPGGFGGAGGGGGGGGGGPAGMSSGIGIGSSAVGPSVPMGFAGVGGGMPPPMAGGYAAANDYETIVTQTPAFNTTVYVGNLIPYSTQQDLIPLFQASRSVWASDPWGIVDLAAQGYGYIVEIRMQADRGFAFVKLDTHEHAAQAICNLQNYQVHGRPIKCSWGKDREGAGAGTAAAPGASPMGVMSPVGGMQQPGGMGMGMMGYTPMASPTCPLCRKRFADSSRHSQCMACRKTMDNITRDTTTVPAAPGLRDNRRRHQTCRQRRHRRDGACRIQRRQRRITNRRGISGVHIMEVRHRATRDRG